MIFFFFSSRRRHTRCGRDWSSDVCSSDLGRALLEALGSRDEDLRAAAGMLLVQSGKRAEPLIAEAIARRQHLPTVLVIAGDLGATALEPELRRFTHDPDPDVARAARDGLRILAAHRRS